MNIMSRLRFGYLAYLSKPKADRVLYQHLRKTPCHAIVEMGLGTGLRTRRMLEVVQRYHGGTKVRYTGVDLFESRPADSPGLTLKEAFKTLSSLHVKLQLLPGDPFMALSRAANALIDTDLVVISADQDATALERAWFYLPRMLHERSLVFREQSAGQPGETTLRLMPREEIERLASVNHKSIRRAA